MPLLRAGIGIIVRREKFERQSVLCSFGTFPGLLPNDPALENVLMARTTDTFSISIPPEMTLQIEELCKREHRTRSELIREALRQYVRLREDAL